MFFSIWQFQRDVVVLNAERHVQIGMKFNYFIQ